MSSQGQRRIASRRSLLQALGAAAVGLSFAPLQGCKKEGQSSSGGGGAGSANQEEKKLNFYNWDTYIGKTTLEDFKTASGVEVNMSLFATNDELFAKLKAGNPGFDVVVPSNEFVAQMTQAGLLMELDHAKIPNIANIGPEFRDPAFDPGRKYSMPYTWLVLGLGYRKSKIEGVPDSWKWVFESDKYKGRIGLLSESADLVRLGAKYLGHSVNGVTPALAKQVEALLIKQKPNVKVFHQDNGQDLLRAGDIDIVIEYNGDIAQIMRESKEFDFVVPKEGSLLNSDCLCIPKGAPRPNNAHAFINFILDANTGKGISETILYPTPNVAARALMPDEYKQNPVIFPTSEGFQKSEFGKFEGPEALKLFEQTIERVRAS